jgi:beta-lactamase regulating signal transducer with metallopeptidase domain/HEAT repeat protein
MVPSILSDIAALPGWNTPMLLFLAKATFILIAALGITIAMQRGSAGARHLVWLGTLATLLLVPAVVVWAPPLRLEILPPAVLPTARSQVTEPQTNASPIESPVAIQDLGRSTSGASTSQASAPESFFNRLSGLSLAVTIWAGIALALVGWLTYGAYAVRRIVRNAHPLDTHDWLTPLYEVADRLELEEPPRLLRSPDARMPFACGFTKPTIVLPTDCESWSAERRTAVLLHELAHVKRHDLIGHTLGRLACAIYWFHPLVWTAAKQLRNESERACDDLALSCGARASDYAEHLLDIVTSVRRDSTPAIALAMARRKEFEGRMLAILDPELRHSMPSRRQSFALIGSLAVIAVLVGAAAPAHRNVEAKGRVATQPNVVDPAFTPQDPAVSKKYDSDTDKSVEKSLDKSTEKVAGRSLDVSARVTTQVEDAEAAAEAETTSDKALEKIAERLGGTVLTAPQGVKDDRPALLANVLRTDSDPALRRTAAWGLSEYADTRVAIDALSEALRKDSDASVREMAAWALADGNANSTTVAALTAAIRSDANERVRVIAVWALGNLDDGDRFDDVLTAALSDRSRQVRVRAIWAIGHTDLREAPKALVAMLRDSDPDVRHITAWALYQLEDPSTVNALNDALKVETNKELQLSYIRALAAMGEKSVDAVRGLLSSSDPKIKGMAVRALAGGNGAGPWPWPWPEPRPFPY